MSVIDSTEAATVYFNLGNAYFDLKKYDEAIKAYARAIELDSNFERASYNLSRLYLETNRVDQAIDVLEELSREDEGNSVVLNTLAYAYTLQERETDALEIYLKVLERSPYDKNALYNVSIILWNKGELEEARASFRSLYELDTGDSIVLYHLGLLEIELENRMKGIEYLELYLEQESNDVDALRILGDAYNEERYYGKAIAAYDKITDAGEADPEIYFKKAYILLTAIGDSEKGFEALEAAITGQYLDAEEYQRLVDDPELVDKERVEQFLTEKGILSGSSAEISGGE